MCEVCQSLGGTRDASIEMKKINLRFNFLICLLEKTDAVIRNVVETKDSRRLRSNLHETNLIRHMKFTESRRFEALVYGRNSQICTLMLA